MAVIKVDNDTRITHKTGGLNWNIEKRRITGDTAKNPGEEIWLSIGHYPTVAVAAKSLLGKLELDTDVSLRELIQVTEKFGKAIVVACGQEAGNVRIKREAAKDLEIAEQQITGFILGKGGNDVEELIESMGLTASDWELIKKDWDADFRKGFRKEVDEIFLKG